MSHSEIQSAFQRPLLRRRFLQVAAAGLWAPQLSWAGNQPNQSKLKAIAFDALAVFDSGSVLGTLSKFFPGDATSLWREWRTRQFEYTWLRNIVGQYQDFWRVTEDALTYAINQKQVHLSPEDRAQLMNGYLELNPWPDVEPTLRKLRETGIRTALLSNFTVFMMNSCIEHSRLNGLFDYVLSTDSVLEFKPSPKAYQLGTRAFQLDRQEVLFVAFGGWDAAGAKTFGYPTYWANRSSSTLEELGVVPDQTAPDLRQLLPLFTA